MKLLQRLAAAAIAADLLEAGRDHGRFDIARMHRVAADVVFHLRAIEGDVLGQGPDGALAGTVGESGRGAAQSKYRRDVHDRAAARLLHGQDRALAAEEGAQRIDVVDPAIVLEAAILDRVAHADAGGIEQAVQAAAGSDRRRDSLLPSRLV